MTNLNYKTSGKMVISLNKGTTYRPKNTITLIIRTPKMVPLILGNPRIASGRQTRCTNQKAVQHPSHTSEDPQGPNPNSHNDNRDTDNRNKNRNIIMIVIIVIIARVISRHSSSNNTA